MTVYEQFTSQLLTSLTADEHVLGLIALGSMAARSRQPDRWSDHDFFVVRVDPEAMRATVDWLPAPERIAFWFRETAHGCKAVYDDGHLVEYAVFAPEELEVARVNDYRVLLDRERIEERMAAVAARREPRPQRVWVEGMFLSGLLVAAARAQRGETFSARWMLAHATRHLVMLLGGGDDDLDPLRRFHHYRLEQALRLGPTAAARELLSIYENEIGGDPRAVAAVRTAIS